MLSEQLALYLARGTSDLPTLPRSVTDALRLARSPQLDLDELSRVAASDPPLAARVISVANAAAYARAGMPRMASVRHAAVRLGTQATRDVLYQVAYASMFVDAPRYRDLIEATFQHGGRVARLARNLAGERGLDVDVAFLAGLLHDIGRARCWKLLAQLRVNVTVAEAAPVVDELHAGAGAELAAAWHLPFEVVEACRSHHEPFARDHALVVAVADTVAHLEETRCTVEDARARLLAAGLLPEAVSAAIAQASGPDAAER